MAAVSCVLRGLWRNQLLTARICTSLSTKLIARFSTKSGDSEHRLCQGINYFKEGSDPPVLPDSEYPDWLWDVLNDQKKSSSNDAQPPDMYNITLVRRQRKLQRRQENAMRKKK